MEKAGAYVGGIRGGRVLDLATGSGGFIGFLREGLGSFDSILGIDENPKAAEGFSAAWGGDPRIGFASMDAARLEFPDSCFDTVSVANSLHHFRDPPAVLAELLRVLKPGGTCIVLEMYRDGQSPAQETHVLLHHWWAEIDRSLGIPHDETLSRADILGLLAGAGLGDLRLHDLADAGADPFDPATIAEIDAVIDRYVQRADGRPGLQARGEELRLLLRERGFQGARSLLAVGEKAGVRGGSTAAEAAGFSGGS